MTTTEISACRVLQTLDQAMAQETVLPSQKETFIPRKINRQRSFGMTFEGVILFAFDVARYNEGCEAGASICFTS